MGINIPQVITETKASGAQVIDGSLSFDSDKKYRIDRTGTSGSGTTWTLSLWVKKQNNDCHVFGAGAGNTPGRFGFGFNSSDKIFAFVIASGSTVFSITTDAVFRDFGWYHIVLVADTRDGTQADRFKVYVNGVLQTVSGTLMPDSQNTFVNSAATHTFGRRSYTDSDHFSGQITNAYLVDGQALDASYFGFDDGLTNTWRPKKYKVPLAETVTVQPTYVSNSSVTDPTNAFDGSSGTEATYGGTGSWLSFTVSDASNLTVPFEIRNDSSATGQTVAMFTDSSGSSAAGGTWASTGTNNLSPAVSTTVEDTYTFPSTGTYYLRHTIGSDSNIFVYRIGGPVTTGANSFYLSMDGNSPIGKDQSGNGNDFTPVNFGGSVALDNPIVSGARPILNTLPGGTQSAAGVFGSKEGFYETVSSSSGGGNPYIFDTRGTQPTLSFIRGATYTFDYSSATSHPLRFATAADAAGSTQYTDGTNVSGNVISFTVPHNAPDTLYYYCTNHSGMGNSISVTTDETKADPYAWKNVLALPLVGSAVDVSNSIACTSTTKSTSVTNAVASNAVSNFYSGSYYFDGSGDHINVTAQSELSLQGDFTIECWTYIDTNVGNGKQISSLGYYVNGKDGNWYFGLSSYGGYEIVFFSYDGQSNAEYVNADLDTPSEDKWYHIAAVRIGTTVTLYVDGVSKASGTISKGLDNGGVDGLTLGRISQSGGSGSYGSLNGYIQDLRIYNGVGKYTSDFVVPSTSPDVLPDTPSGLIGSSKLTKVPDGGSVYFAGGNGGPDISWTGTIASTFTLDLYLYVDGNQSSGAGPIFLSDGTDGIQLDLSGSNLIRMEKSNGGSDSGFQPLNGGWNHVRCVVEGTSAGMFINGKSAGTCAPNGGTIGPATLWIGTKARLASSVWFKGYMCNVRIIEAALPGTASPVIENGIIASSEGGTSAIFLWPGVNSVTENTGSDGDSLTATSSPVLTDFNPFNTDINTVRGRETGYATLNPLMKGSQVTLSNGNLDFVVGGGTGRIFYSTLGVTSGKWYAELTAKTISTANMIGVSRGFNPTANYLGVDSNHGYGYYGSGQKYNGSGSSYADSYTTGDTIGIALDLDERTLTFYKNGISQGVAFSNLPDGDYYFAGGESSMEGTMNFGQKPFKFPPPDGFQPLNTANVRPETVIARPDQYVGISTWTGDNNNRFIEYGMQPDLFVVKARNDSYRNGWFDSVRGFKNVIWSDRNLAETNYSTYPEDPNSHGIVVNNDDGQTNQNTKTYVGWAWKAGGNKNTFNVDDVGYATAAAAGLTGGNITPTGASVGTKQGFSIVKFTGPGSAGFQSVPHGLSEKPKFILCKDLDNNRNWSVFHEDVITVDNKVFYFNLALAATNSDTSTWDVSAINATTFTPYFRDDYGASYGADNIAYLWHDVPGLQKFGTYTGNGASGYPAADGPFIELGFLPRIIIIKSSTTDEEWIIYDTERNKVNYVNSQIALSSSAVEATGDNRAIDVLSNGFKIRNNNGRGNTNGATYIYAAWAEAPLTNLFGGQSNAR